MVEEEVGIVLVLILKEHFPQLLVIVLEWQSFLDEFGASGHL